MILLDTLLANEKPTGIGVYTLNLVKNLRKYIDFTVLTHTPEVFPKGLKFKKAPKIVSPSNGKKGAFYRTLYLQTLVGKDILYRTYHHISLFWFGKQIITIHDLLPVIFPERYKEQYYLYRYFLKPFINRVDFVFTVSKRSKDDILRFFGLKEEKVKVFYQGYNSEVFKPITQREKVLQVKNRYGLFDYVLIVGAQYIHKNVEVVIKAMKFLEGLQLLITGTRKPYEDKIFETINRLGLNERIKVLRYVPQEDLVYLYAGSLAVAIPSKYEGFGIPVLEAMAVGVPVIGTEAVREAGGNAILYADPDSVESWVEGIKSAINRREELVLKGFERVKMFSWDKTAKEISEFIKTIM